MTRYIMLLETHLLDELTCIKRTFFVFQKHVFSIILNLSRKSGKLQRIFTGYFNKTSYLTERVPKEFLYTHFYAV